MLGVWDDVLQTQPLSPAYTLPIPHTHTHWPNCTHINMLTVCIHPANMLVTHEDGCFSMWGGGGFKIREYGSSL